MTPFCCIYYYFHDLLLYNIINIINIIIGFSAAIFTDKVIYSGRNPESKRFHPFTRGPRDCFGKNFAQAEMRIIIPTGTFSFFSSPSLSLFLLVVLSDFCFLRSLLSLSLSLGALWVSTHKDSTISGTPGTRKDDNLPILVHILIVILSVMFIILLFRFVLPLVAGNYRYTDDEF